MSRTTKDDRQGDMFSLPPPPAPPHIETCGEEGEEGEADDEALQCVDCGELGAVGEFIWHDEAGGALCPSCDHKREPNCSECGRAFWDERGIRNVARFHLPTGKFLCYFCCERHREDHRPQRDLDRNEATGEAIALMARLPWRDDLHRQRCLFHIRGGMDERPRQDEKGRRIKHSAGRVERIFRQTRRRSLAEIADEYWPLLVEYDASLREGRELEAGVDRWRPKLLEQMHDLEVESNNRSPATHGGRRDYPGPYRLRALIKWRARREGRLPMYGIEQRWRFECRGMHVIANTKYSLDFTLDRDKHRPGDPSFSSTGYRSFSGAGCLATGETPEQWARRELEEYIDAPKGKDGFGGLGGKLERWIPWAAEPWARYVGNLARGWYDDASPESHARDRDEAGKALAWMQERGIDPYELFPDAPRQEKLL